ncbi:MAG: DUF6199 family natural product biosynthesis protein [Heyndrickxia sp.]
MFFYFQPEWSWYISESWKSSAGSEPSDTYILLTRAAGIFGAWVGIFIFFGSILKKIFISINIVDLKN